MQVPKRKSEEFRKYGKGSSGPLHITQEAYDKLKKNLSRLESDLPGQIKEVERTKANGDFSENAEYQDAKATMRRTHARIASIKDKLKRAQIITSGSHNGGGNTVRLGSTVKVEVNGRERVFQILGSHEANPAEGKVSNESPLGEALLGRSVGETVKIETKKGTIEYKIINIE